MLTNSSRRGKYAHCPFIIKFGGSDIGEGRRVSAEQGRMISSVTQMGGRCQIGPLNILQNLQNKLLPQTVQTLWNDLEGLSPVTSPKLLSSDMSGYQRIRAMKSPICHVVSDISYMYVYVHLLRGSTSNQFE